MDFIDPENIYYEYRLKELSSEWSSTLPGINQVTYNHLNPGKYTLEVKAGKFGAFSQPKEFSIIISPPWLSLIHICLPRYLSVHSLLLLFLQEE